ncbi:MAG: carbohydrate ABC transporter permease [Acidimicrobiales bacterium]
MNVPAAPESATRRRHRDQPMVAHRALSVTQIAVVVGVFLLPIVWMVISSLKTARAVTAYPPKLFFHPTMANYVHDLVTLPFLRYGLNSLIIAGGSTILGLLLGLPAAYAAARYRLSWPAFVTLLARMAPGILFLIPWYVFASAHGLTNNFLVLIAAHAVITVPLTVWLMVSFFEQIPIEIEESAVVDGCLPFGVLLRIAIPLVRPGIAVAAILSFIFSWNYFLFVLVLGGNSTTTLPVAAFRFIGSSSVNYGGLLAAAVLMSIPPALLVGFVQRWLVSGLTSGAVNR